MSERMGIRPSDLAHIGCEFCAYCFDEALVVRQSFREREQLEEAQEEMRQEDNKTNLQSALRAVPGV